VFHKNLALGGELEVYGMLPLMIGPLTQGIFTCRNNPFRVWQGADMRQDGKIIAMITGASPPRVYLNRRLQGKPSWKPLPACLFPPSALTFRRFLMVYRMKRSTKRLPL
jgi:hypothetical protein